MQQIKPNLWQVAGGDLTYSGDAAAYLVRFGDHGALIDAGTGFGSERLYANIRNCLMPDASLDYLLLTHCHFDHTGGAAAIRDAFGCRIAAHHLEAAYLSAGDSRVTAADWYGARLDPFEIDIQFRGDTETIQLGDGRITMTHWPGHSPGSVVYTTRLADELVLFGQDVHGPIHPALLSDADAYQASLKKLLTLEADILCEGHYGVIRGQKAVADFIRSFMTA